MAVKGLAALPRIEMSHASLNKTSLVKSSVNVRDSSCHLPRLKQTAKAGNGDPRSQNRPWSFGGARCSEGTKPGEHQTVALDTASVPFVEVSVQSGHVERIRACS